MYSYGPPHMVEQKQDDQLEPTCSSYVRIQDIALRTCQKRWTIGISGERGSGIFVLAAWYDVDDDEWLSNSIVMNSLVIFSKSKYGIDLAQEEEEEEEEDNKLKRK